MTFPTVLSVCTIDITFTTRSHSLNWRAVKTPMGVFLPSTFFFISTYTPPVHWIIPCWLNGKTSTNYKEENALLARETKPFSAEKMHHWGSSISLMGPFVFEHLLSKGSTFDFFVWSRLLANPLLEAENNFIWPSSIAFQPCFWEPCSIIPPGHLSSF